MEHILQQLCISVSSFAFLLIFSYPDKLSWLSNIDHLLAILTKMELKLLYVASQDTGEEDIGILVLGSSTRHMSSIQSINLTISFICAPL